jgi:hypothetical protein
MYIRLIALFSVTTPIGALCGLLSTKAFKGEGVVVRKLALAIAIYLLLTNFEKIAQGVTMGIGAGTFIYIASGNQTPPPKPFAQSLIFLFNTQSSM